MKRTMRLVALASVLALAAVACAGDDGGDGTQTQPPEQIPTGGTLKMAMLGDVTAAFDPQKEYYSVTWEYYRCCLLRTLMSYNGKPTDQGGTELFPDLAAGEPEVSADGLTWTFKLKEGITYAPPLEEVEITAQDFIRAMEREANPKASVNGYPFYYSVIKGFDEFSEGEADSIEGLSAPDDKTLQIEVTGPTGDLAYRMAMPAAAPIPPNPDDPDARLGVAEGHDRNYGRFLVSSGPYMFEGSENLDFSVPAGDREPVAGYTPGRSIVLVRNPSWAQDDLRPAYVDRIEVTIGGDNDDLYNQIAAGELDFVVDGVVPADKIREYQTNPDLQERINAYFSDAVRYLSFNLAEPPFDDVHVRKALNWALDKEGMRQLRGGETTGDIAGHIFVDSLQGGLLSDYDPYATPNNGGDIEAAKEEMAQSAYDSDGDGVCDDPACEGILAMTDREDPYPQQAALIQEILDQLGMTLDVRSLERGVMYNKCNEPPAKVAICLGPAWGKDYADGYTFGPPLFGAEGLSPSCCNYSLVGATPEQLDEWGYEVSEVPSVEEKLAECAAQTETDARFQCWADVDRILMEEVVPWVPYLFDTNVDIISERIVNYSFDQFAGLAAFDQFAIAAEAQ